MSLPFQTFLKKLFLSFCLNSISWILAYSKCSDKFGNNFGNETNCLIQFVIQVLYLISTQNLKHIWTFFSILISDAESGREKQGVQISWRCPFISGKIFPITVILLLHIYYICSTGNNIHHVNTYWPVLVIIEDLCYIVDTIIIHYC